MLRRPVTPRFAICGRACRARRSLLAWGQEELVGPEGTWSGWFHQVGDPKMVDSVSFDVMSGNGAYDGLTFIWEQSFDGTSIRNWGRAHLRGCSPTGTWGRPPVHRRGRSRRLACRLPWPARTTAGSEMTGRHEGGVMPDRRVRLRHARPAPGAVKNLVTKGWMEGSVRTMLLDIKAFTEAAVPAHAWAARASRGLSRSGAGLWYPARTTRRERGSPVSASRQRRCPPA